MPVAIVILSVLAVGCGAPDSDDSGTTADAAGDRAAVQPTPATLPPPATAVRYADVTAELGVEFVHQTGSRDNYFMPAIMAGGACAFDGNGDGRLDLYFVQAGDRPPGQGRSSVGNAYFEQQPDGHFEDRSQASGLDDRGYGMGCAVGDVDNDGDLDVFVSNYGPDSLLVNDGSGRFADAGAASGIAGGGWSASAVFFDADRDGLLDLYVARYVAHDPAKQCAQEGGRFDYCGPAQFSGLSDRFYRNQGLGQGGAVRFENRTAAAGFRALEDRGLGVVAADFDEDGWPDLYVANDSDPNHLWINRGDGTFSEEALLEGVAFNRFGVGEAGMGVVADDPDGDGDLDLFVSHLIEESNTLYLRGGAAGFEDATAEQGLGVASVPYTGFGTELFDYDNDGDLDLAVVNGAVKLRPDDLLQTDWFWSGYAEPNLLFENVGGGRFVPARAEAAAFTEPLEISRGLLAVDLEGDGDIDLVVTNIEGRARVLRNEGGHQASWVQLRVVDPSTRRVARGARVRLHVAGASTQRWVRPHAGYLSSGEAPLHVGLGDTERVETIEVTWPDGEVEEFPGAAPGGLVTLERGQGGGQEQ